MTNQDREARTRHGTLVGPRILAAVLLALGLLLIVSALGVARGGGYSVIGPATIPLVVAIGLLLLSVAFALRTTVRPDVDLATLAADEEAVTHWPTVGLAGLMLVVYALALDGFAIGPLDVPGLGYIVATALFVPLTGRVLGSESPIRDVIAGVAIAVLVYIGFTEFLGVRLPAGILGPVL
jgi:putative tricarboxylic transport membrane protein